MIHFIWYCKVHLFIGKFLFFLHYRYIDLFLILYRFWTSNFSVRHQYKKFHFADSDSPISHYISESHYRRVYANVTFIGQFRSRDCMKAILYIWAERHLILATCIKIFSRLVIRLMVHSIMSTILKKFLGSKSLLKYLIVGLMGMHPIMTDQMFIK